MMRYTLGFCFDQECKVVALIKKARPDWMRGKLNGIGGKVEAGEDHLSGHVREFGEETEGPAITRWALYCRIISTDPNNQYSMHVYSSFTNDVFGLRTPKGSDEPVIIMPIHHIFPQDLVESVR
jgi:8-oxo-dGTP pyrophosphatase MutT (NUDIX family)